MHKYLLRYLVFWLPAVIVSYFFTNDLVLSHVLQWFTATFMLFGFAVNTGMMAYQYPWSALSALLCYSGVHLMLNVLLFTQGSESAIGGFLWKYAGIFSFAPLDIFVRTLKPFRVPLPWTLIVTGLLVAVCLLGYLVGLLRRRSSPNPYRPRMNRA